MTRLTHRPVMGKNARGKGLAYFLEEILDLILIARELVGGPLGSCYVVDASACEHAYKQGSTDARGERRLSQKP